MAEAQIVVDVEASPLSESMQPKLDRGKTNETKNSTIMEEAHIVLELETSPLSESMQPELNRGKTNAAKNSTIKEEAQIVIELEASPLSESMQLVDLKAPLQRQLDTLWGNANEEENFTIFCTPHNLTQSKKKKNLFKPSVISIGPFHHGQKHLRALDEKKRRFLRDFLTRGDNISLDLCLSAMKSLETRTRRCYNETFDHLNSDTFVEMMLLDGCFVLEYYFKTMEGSWNSIREDGWNSHFIYIDFLLLENQIPFFIVEKLYELIGFNQYTRMILLKYIAYDLLPNNSIFRDPPAETPDTIDSIISDTPTETPDSIDSIIPDPPTETPYSIDSIIPDPPAETPDTIDSTDSIDIAYVPNFDLAKVPDPPAEIHHLVHLCYHYLVPDPEQPVVLSSKPFDLTIMFRAIRIIKGLLHRFCSSVLRRISLHSTSGALSVALPNSTRNLSSLVIPSATELKEAGVKFTPKTNPKHMLDISFEYGVLKIPQLEIGDSTKPFFANLLAFEHSIYAKENSPFVSFVHFWDNLVNTPNDVTILQQCGIIENWLGNEEEVTHFFNQVTEGNMYYPDHYLAELYTEVNRYIESSWNRQRAIFIRDYFSSPWAAISLVAALILLALTCVQTFYAVYAYKFPPSS